MFFERLWTDPRTKKHDVREACRKKKTQSVPKEMQKKRKLPAKKIRTKWKSFLELEGKKVSISICKDIEKDTFGSAFLVSLQCRKKTCRESMVLVLGGQFSAGNSQLF